MKDVILNKNQKSKEKVFTKKKVSNTIRKNYNPLKVDCRLIYKRRDGLYNMEKTETILLNEITEELDFKQRIIAKLLKKMLIKVYKIGIEKGFNSRM